MTTYALRCNKETHEPGGILYYENPSDLWHAAWEDPNHDYMAITFEQFMHLQHAPCGAPPHHHRFEGCQLVEKTKLKLECDKHFITISKDTAAIKWNCDQPLHLSINTIRTEQKHNNELNLTGSVAGVYTIEVCDPEFYSDPIVLRVEEPLDKEE